MEHLHGVHVIVVRKNCGRGRIEDFHTRNKYTFEYKRTFEGNGRRDNNNDMILKSVNIFNSVFYAKSIANASKQPKYSNYSLHSQNKNTYK